MEMTDSGFSEWETALGVPGKKQLYSGPAPAFPEEPLNSQGNSAALSIVLSFCWT